MEYFLFNTTTGNYVGIRGSIPDENENLTAVESNENTIAAMSTPYTHKLVNGEIVDDEPLPVIIPAEASSARFWLAVYELWNIEQPEVITLVENQFPGPMATRIKIMMNAGVFERTNPLLMMVAQAKNKTSQDLDQIFIIANEPYV